jgi:hypothetical protein
MPLLYPFVIKAFADAPSLGPVGLPNTATSTTITGTIANLFTSVLNIILLIAGILAVFYLVYAGIMYITSAGDPGKVKTARATIVNAVIGIIIIVCTFTIIKVAVRVGGYLNGTVSSTNTGGTTTGGTTTNPAPYQPIGPVNNSGTGPIVANPPANNPPVNDTSVQQCPDGRVIPADAQC